MKKNKIVFAGVMGAILMSAGANAAVTSVATKGYVDQQVGTVNTKIENLGDTYVTINDIADVIANDATLKDKYQLTDNMVQAINEVAIADTTKYPSVAAVSAAITEAIAGLGLTPEQIKALQSLVADNGVVSQLNALKGRVDILTGEGAGSVAQSIADAITAHTTAADAKYQAQSTADFQIGTTGGVFRPMTDAEKAALSSGVTAEKVSGYDATKTTVDGLTGENGTITELQTAIDGLNGKDGQPGKIETIETTVKTIETIVGDETDGLVADVAANTAAIAENAGAIAENAESIAANTAEIAKKITMPAACASGNQTCVLMTANGTLSWTPVTSPVEDPASTPEVSQ